MKYTPSPTTSIGSIENCEQYAKEEDIAEQLLPGQQQLAPLTNPLL